MKTFKIQITEEELVALIAFHTGKLRGQAENMKPSKETAERLVDLTRRLNKDTPDIEGDPRPTRDYIVSPPDRNGQIEAGKENAKLPEGW